MQEFNIAINLDKLAFDSYGRQIGIEIPDALLDQISGGLMGNGECGTKCQGSDNKTCGNSCATQIA